MDASYDSIRNVYPSFELSISNRRITDELNLTHGSYIYSLNIYIYVDKYIYLMNIYIIYRALAKLIKSYTSKVTNALSDYSVT